MDPAASRDVCKGKVEDGDLESHINATVFASDVPPYLLLMGPFFGPGYFHVLMVYHSDKYSCATLSRTKLYSWMERGNRNEAVCQKMQTQ